jgi:peptidoglycan LD-endopeptidase LytH
MNALMRWNCVAVALVLGGCNQAGDFYADDSASAAQSVEIASPDIVGRAGQLADTATPAPPATTPSIGAVLDTHPAAAVSSGEFIVPVQGVTASQLRDTFSESRGGRVHEAIDIPAARGTPVLAATAGKVTKLHSSRAGGLMVYASDEADELVLMYGHLDRYAEGLVEGMALRQGQVIGYVGTTGNAPANTPHLHFAVARGKPSVAWWKGTAINPYPLLMITARKRG